MKLNTLGLSFLAALTLAQTILAQPAFAASKKKFKTELMQKTYERILEQYPESFIAVGENENGQPCTLEVSVSKHKEQYGDVFLPDDVSLQINTLDPKESLCDNQSDLEKGQCYGGPSVSISHNVDTLKFINRADSQTLKLSDYFNDEGGIDVINAEAKIGLNKKGEILSVDLSTVVTPAPSNCDGKCEVISKKIANCHF